MDPTQQREFVVEIVEDDTDKVLWASAPATERTAERIADGAGINLDWSRYSVRVVPAVEQ